MEKVIRRIGTALGYLIHGDIGHLTYSLTTRVQGLDLIAQTQEELGTDPAVSAWYSDSGGPDLKAVLDSLDIRETDSAIDIGCGKGGALITMAQYPFRTLAGVEISSELVRVAERNLHIAHVKNCRIIHCDATQFEDLDQFTFVYFYNPFPCQIMAQVMRQIEMSLLRCPRSLTLIYNNPVCHEVITGNSLFTMERTFSSTRSRNPIAVYRHNALHAE